MTSTSRRAILAGLAAVPSDPIFILIERHRAAWDEYAIACEKDGEMAVFEIRKAEAEEEATARYDEHIEAWIDLLSTRPTTAAGCAALLRYVNSCVNDKNVFEGAGLFSDSDWNPRISEPAHRFLVNVAAVLEAAGS